MAVTAKGRLVVLRGQRNPIGPKTRTCPKCEAKPGHSCGRWVGHSDARYSDGTRYWKTMTTFHPERKNA